MKKRSHTVLSTRVSLVVVLFLIQSTAVAQNMMHMNHGEMSSMAKSVPVDDAVLASAPQRLMLMFEQDVRLVKLTLHTPERDWIDIDFRYDPHAGKHFTWPLPELKEADYYTANWAIIRSDERLIKGRFSFSFGPDARAPSELMPEKMEMRHIMVPDYRTLFQDGQ
ncbi:MAG: copper resistance protein CopC [Cellvibrionaceae bacterium]